LSDLAKNTALFLPSYRTDSQEAKAEEKQGHGLGDSSTIYYKIVDSHFNGVIVVK
jgi:hypothetical protein